MTKLFLSVMMLYTPSITSAADTAKMRLDAFSAHEERAMNTFARLAQQIRVPIGVSGKMIDSDFQRRISVDSKGMTVAGILDEICRKDTRFKWSFFADGGVNVTAGGEELSLIDVRIVTAELRDVMPRDLSVVLLDISEIRKWAHHTNCLIGHRVAIAGVVPHENSPTVNLVIADEPLWKALNKLALATSGYFWSLIQYKQEPCYISFDPPS